MYYGLLGEHLSHSYSPLIHSMLGDYEYRLIEKSPEELCDFIKNGDYKAINVTVPYKTAVMPYLDELSEAAERIKSTNIILRREDGTLYGDNSDYYGLSYLIKSSHIRIKGRKALVLGSGGASLTARAVLSDMGAGSITVISRRGEDNYENLQRHYDAEIIVNTTPVGMYPNNGERIIDVTPFKRLCGVFDLIYNPQKTALILDCEEKGIPAFSGLRMLVAQAVRAYEVFFSKPAPEGITEKIEKRISVKMKNIALIGMPGCGKSAVGKRLSAMTGRELYDIDRLIEKRAKKTIPEIFAEDGEEAFRALESEITREISKKSAIIISTGGGVVTREENRQSLWQNSTVVFIHRPIDELSTKGRPLSANGGVFALYESRAPLYKSWSHIKVANTGISGTANAIARALQLQTKKRK